MKISIKSTPIGKPQDPQGANITFGWSAVDIPPQRLVAHITQGRPFAVAHYQDNHRKNSNFIASDLIALDVDGVEGRPLTEAEWQHLLTDPFITKNAFAVVQSFSSKPDAYKARILFQLDQTITDFKVYSALVRHIMTAYCPWADRATKDAARSFYGGQPGRPADFLAFENCLAVAPLLEVVQQQQAQRQAKQLAQASRPASTDTDQQQSYLQKALENALHQCNHAAQGQGNLTLFKAACGLFGLVKGGYWSQGEVEAHLYGTDAALRRPEAETRSILASAWNTAEPRIIPAAKAPPSPTLWELEQQIVQAAEAPPTELGISREEQALQFHFPGRYHYHEVLSQYLNESVKGITAPITLVKSPIGSGKTEWLTDMLAGALKSKSVLCITHRRSLSRDQANRMGLAHYEEVNFKGALPQALVITLDSLYKITDNGHLPPFDVILLDESEQVIRHLAGATFRQRKAQGAPPAKTAYNLLVALLQQSEHIIALDADLDDRTQSFLARACPDKPAQLIVNRYKRPRPPMQLYASAEEARVRFLAHLQAKAPGELLAVACDSANDARALAHQATALGMNGLCVTGEDSEYASTKTLFKDFNKALKALDFFIYSSAIGTGVDIQYPVHTVYGLFSNKSIVPSDQLQMLGRCRNVQHTVVGSNCIAGGRCTDSALLYQEYLRDVRQLAALGVEMTWLTPQGDLTPDHADFLKLICEIERDYNESMNQNRWEFLRQARYRYAIQLNDERIATEEVKSAAKEAKKATREAQKAAVLSAVPLNDQEYYDYMQGNGGSSPQAKAANTKCKIQKTYHTEEVTPTLYDDWLDNGPTKLLNFILLQSDLPASLIFDQDQVDRPMDIHHLAVMSPKIQFIQQLIAVIFPNGLHSDYLPLEEVEAQWPAFEALWSQADGNGATLLGRKLGKVPKTTVGKFRAVLDLFGLTFTQQWHNKGYHYQLQKLEKMQAYMDQFIRGEIASGTPQKFSIYIHQKKSGQILPRAAFRPRKPQPQENTSYLQQEIPWDSVSTVPNTASMESPWEIAVYLNAEGSLPPPPPKARVLLFEEFTAYLCPKFSEGTNISPTDAGSQEFSIYIHQKISGESDTQEGDDPPE